MKNAYNGYIHFAVIFNRSEKGQLETLYVTISLFEYTASVLIVKVSVRDLQYTLPFTTKLAILISSTLKWFSSHLILHSSSLKELFQTEIVNVVHQHMM